MRPELQKRLLRVASAIEKLADGKLVQAARQRPRPGTGSLADVLHYLDDSKGLVPELEKAYTLIEQGFDADGDEAGNLKAYLEAEKLIKHGLQKLEAEAGSPKFPGVGSIWEALEVLQMHLKYFAK